jgi:hypothetical protein
MFLLHAFNLNKDINSNKTYELARQVSPLVAVQVFSICYAVFYENIADV